MSLQAMKEHGVFSWNELVTTDVPAAKTFLVFCIIINLTLYHRFPKSGFNVVN